MNTFCCLCGSVYVVDSFHSFILGIFSVYIDSLSILLIWLSHGIVSLEFATEVSEIYVRSTDFIICII